MLEIPDRFNKNATEVRAMGSAAETGSWLIDYMCERIGIADLGGSDVLDFGCGCRFIDSFLNLSLPVRSYLGVDVDREMVDWLVAHITDERLAVAWWNARNPFYNPSGQPIGTVGSLPVGARMFDIECMFSVITHQLPEDAAVIFRLLRNCIRDTGRLFFSVTLDDAIDGYAELDPDATAGHSGYSPALLRRLLEEAGWRILSIAPRRPERSGGFIPVQDSVLCAPAERTSPRAPSQKR